MPESSDGKDLNQRVADIILDYQPWSGYSAAGYSHRDAADVIVALVKALESSDREEPDGRV